MRALTLIVALGIGLVPSGCAPATKIESGKCQSNADCPEYTICDPAGVCRCNDDDACDATEFCNLAGSCQVKLECFTNEDCATPDNPGARCDTRQAKDALDASADDGVFSTTGGQCITLNAQRQCLLDSHCPLGTYCANDACIPGCRDNGDCPLGDPCLAGTCDPTPGACNGDYFCAFGETCINSRCVPHPDADVLCQRCRGDDPADFSCGFGTPCLIDNSVPSELCTNDSQCDAGYCVKFGCLSDQDCPTGETCEDSGFFGGRCSGHCGDFFCGNDACDDATDPCPRGYSCSQLIYVSNDVCTPGGGECRAGSRCSADGGSENVLNGYCSCLNDGDCPAGLTCSNPGPAGACIGGSTCGPSDGLLCGDLVQ